MKKNIVNLTEKFFYALNDAELYDATIQLTVPHYDLIHNTIIDILYHHFRIIDGKSKNDVEGLFLDIGAGTGKESLLILDSFPNINCVAVDLSPQMKEAFIFNSNKLLGSLKNNRTIYVVKDIFDIDFKKKNHFLKKYKNQKHLAAISAYCIHHYTLAQKKIIYEKMFDFLDPGGIFMNIDLYNYQSPTISKYAHIFDIDYIRREFKNPSPEFIESRKLSSKIRKDLETKWISHMENDNILDSIDIQIKTLKKIGFKEVECVFRYIQQGIIVAIK